MEWHVDSWAVRDGFAFASWRNSGDIAGAERTVFIGVPELVPVPIGRVSTALWATRGNFQDRFTDPADQEIGFPKLEQVIELVRRAYIAGGIGPGPGPGEGEERRGPRPNHSGGGETRLEDGLKELEVTAKWDPQLRPTAEKHVRDQRFKQIVQDPHIVETLYDYLRVFAEATLIKAAEELLARRSTAELADFGRWLRTLYRIGLWRQPHHIDAVLGQPDVRQIVEALDPWLFERPVYYPGLPWPYIGSSLLPPSWTAAPVHEQVVLDVPCPTRQGWDPFIRKLSDKLFLALSTRDYFDANAGLPEFIPSLLAALAIVVQAEEQRFDWTGDSARSDRLKAALDWLSREMPQVRLPDAAESALDDFAWGELRRT